MGPFDFERLHELEPPPISLPPPDPFDEVATRLERSEISAETRTYLRLWPRSWLPSATICGSHSLRAPQGDCNVGNVLHDAAGHPKVIDLDGFVVGPREWDLMQTAMYYDSFGWHTEGEYADFVLGYGFDVRQWSGYTVLRRGRELLMVLWLSQNAGTNPRAAEEVEKRVDTLRSGGSRRDWAPF